MASALSDRTDRALADEGLRASVRNATGIMVDGRVRALAGVENADQLRDAAQAIRRRAVERLPDLLGEWQRQAEAAGVQVHRAATGADAVATVLDIVRAAKARTVVKGKSMASEEIHLNEALEADGMTVVETDLGEFIIQLAGETPSHIIAPAIHKNRYDVAELFTADAHEDIPADIGLEAAYARRRLREAFLGADVGITGVNFAVAETGSICLVENEGNGRMCTSLPRIHIAIMGMERIVATWDELDVMLSLLARSATGQQLSVYTNILTGPRRPAAGEVDGPDELHVVVLDNGRSAVRTSEFADALDCIRCGACLNVCPVYRQIGGHAYGAVYSGPIGAVLTPLLHPESAEARELSEASSLCSACWDVCPVRIPLHDLLLGLRRRDAPAAAGPVKRYGFAAWSWLWSTRFGFDVTRLAVRASLPLAARLRLRRGPGWMGAWTRTRDVPK